MAPTIDLLLDSDRLPEHWTDERTVAVVHGQDDNGGTGVVTLLELPEAPADLRFIAAPEAPAGLLTPLFQAAAGHVRDSGGTALRWIAEEHTMPESVLAELSAVPGEEVCTWWGLELPADLPTTGKATLDCAVEVHEEIAELWLDRVEEGTAAELAAALATAVRGLPEGIAMAATAINPEDEELIAAATHLGFQPTTRRAVEYLLALD